MTAPGVCQGSPEGARGLIEALQVRGCTLLLRRLSRQLDTYLGNQVYTDRRRRAGNRSQRSQLYDPAATAHLASTLLHQLQREQQAIIADAIASVQELRKAARTRLAPIPDEDVPPDLRAGIVCSVRHAGFHPEALAPYCLEAEPAAGLLARQMLDLLDPLDVTVLIGVDESGSKQHQVEPSRRALFLLHGALRRLHIPHAIVGHSATWFGRVIARILVGFRESLRPTAWWSLANRPDLRLRFREPCGWEARDGYSLRLGAQWLARQPQRQKLLLFISDGQVNHTFRPAAAPGDPRYDYSLYGGVGVLDTRLAVREAEKSGIQVVGISIGEAQAYMESIYPRRICCRSVEELLGAFVQVFSSLPREHRGRLCRADP